MASNLTQDLDKPKGLGKLNGFLAPKSYVVGYYPSKEDADLFKELSKHWGSGPDAKFAHARRWWAHINSFSEDERNSWTSPEVKQKHTEQKKEEHKPQEHKKEEEKKEEKKKQDEEEEEDDGGDLFGGDDDEELEKEAKKIAEESKKDAKPVRVQKSNVILDVKPYTSETKMDELEKLVRDIKMDGLVWGPHKMVDIAYGVQKLQITCVVEDEKVNMEDLEELIKALGNEEMVQSVDVAAMVRVG